MRIDPTVLAAILAMGLATYVTRLIGWLLASRLVLAGRTKAAVEAIPGCMLVSVIAPMLLLAGPADFLAGILTILAVRWFPLVGVLLVGIVSAGLLRAILP